MNRIRDFVTALRSGEYRQMTGQLGAKDGDCATFCCEGVAAERYGDQLGFDVNWIDETLFMNDFTEWADDNFWAVMGLAVSKEVVGAESAFAFVPPTGQEIQDTGADSVSYMGLNDDGFTFPQIADLIEWQFLSR